MADLNNMLEDLDGDIRAPQASELSAKQLVEELERRGIKPTGFPEDDIKKLQRALDDEFDAEKEERVRARKDALEKKRQEEEALLLQRFLEKCAREEAEALEEDGRAAFFADLARHNATPTELIFRSSPNAVRAFVKTLGACTSLQYLDLCNSSLADDVGAELGAVLRTNSALRILELDYNRLGPRTATALAQGLAANSSLQRLSLSHNRLTGDEAARRDYSGLTALAHALGSNTSLVSLGLFRVGLGARGCAILLDGLASNTSVVNIALDPADGAGAADMAGIAEVVKSNAEAEAKAVAAGKAMRAEARRQAAEEAAEAARQAALRAEEEWIALQAAERQRVREEISAEKMAAEIKARVLREQREKERWERIKAEEAEATKKKKK